MKERDVEAALETARGVFDGELKIDECLEYIKALLAVPSRRQAVGMVQEVAVNLSEGISRSSVAIEVHWFGQQAQHLKPGDELHTELPRLRDDQFRDAVNDLRDLTKKYAGTEQLRAQLSFFLRDFENAVRGEK